MDTDKLHFELMRDEGVRLTVYKDSLGIWSIGAGRNVDPDHGGGLSQLEMLYLLNNDISSRWMQLMAALPWITALSDARQRALINMSFMGVSKLLGFKKMLADMEAGNWEAAVAELDDSLWSHQVDDGIGGKIGRADRVAALILNG
jgi:lysozyme